MEAMAALLKAQASQIQKANAELATASPSRGGLGVDKSSPQIVLNNK